MYRIQCPVPRCEEVVEVGSRSVVLAALARHLRGLHHSQSELALVLARVVVQGSLEEQ